MESSSSGSPSGSKDTPGPKKDVWVCDVCHIAKFDVFEEACQHERECGGATDVRAVGGDREETKEEGNSDTICDGGFDGGIDMSGESPEEHADTGDLDSDPDPEASLPAAEVKTPPTTKTKSGLIFFGPLKTRKNEPRTNTPEEKDTANCDTVIAENITSDTKNGEDVTVPEAALEIIASPHLSSSSSPPKSRSPPSSDGSSSTVMEQRWVCDVCREVSFQSFEEADMHEKVCAEEKRRRENDGHEDDPASNAEVTNVSGETKKDNAIQQEPEAVESSGVTGTDDEKHEVDSSQKDEKAKEGGDLAPRRSGRSRTQRVLYTETFDEGEGGKKKKTDSPAKPCKSSGQKRKETSSVAAPASIFQKKAEKKRQRKPSAADCGDAGTKNKIPVKVKPVASIFGGGASKKALTNSEPKEKSSTGTPKASSKVLAEHRAAEFAAKRRLEREREKERQRKREEARKERREATDATGSTSGGLLGCPAGDGGKKRQRDASDSATCAIDLTGVKSSSSSKAAATLSSAAPAPRFPTPSHVICSDPQISPKSSDHSSYVEARAALRAMARYPAAGPANDSLPDGSDDPSILAKDLWLKKAEREGNRDVLADAFSLALVPPPVSVSDSEDSSSAGSKSSSVQPWPDKHCIRRIPHDICGERNRGVAQQLLEFIGEWRQHRQEVLARRAEARAEKARQSKKKSKKKYRDDDLWDQSDMEDEGLSNVFVVTGPTGSGKTNLVHAAAHQSECVVVEINTVEQRGGAALKRAIEECTQSDSSLAMLKRRDLSPGVVYHLGEEEDDADDESSSDEDEDDSDREDDGGRKKKAPSLALVLIDEVDNIFEEDGDAGFWLALSQLSKKAKCPILLTANVIPAALLNSPIYFRSAELAHPMPADCAERMIRIAKAEGMTTRANDDDKCRAQLAVAAELCGCDLRRIANEMQLFSRGATAFADISGPANSFGSGDTKAGKDEFGNVRQHSSVHVLPPPVITGIDTRIIPFDRHTLITIKGEHFRIPLGLEKEDSSPTAVDVWIGNTQCSEFRVVDSSTILAVCPPCPIPSGVDKSGAFVTADKMMEDCLTIRYAPVSIRVRTASGLILRSNATVVPEEPQDPQLQGTRIFNVGYHFPEIEGDLEKLCKKTLAGRKKKRRLQKKGKSKIDNSGFMSSSDDDFDVLESSSTGNKSLRIAEEEDLVACEKSKSISEDSKEQQPPQRTPDKSQAQLQDPVEILEMGVTSFLEAKKLLDSVDAKVDTDESEFCEPTVNVVSDASSWSECCASPLKHDDFGTKSMDEVHAMEQWAKQMELLSDAALFEDSHTSLIPALAGSCRGFGSDLVTRSAAGDGDNMLKKSNAKPPSFERLFSMNDSSFFGSAAAYLTQPSAKRERLMLARASVTKGDTLSDCCCAQSTADMTMPSDLGSGDSVTVDPEVPATELGDIFLVPQSPASLSVLSSLLFGNSAAPGRRGKDETGILDTIARRKCERAKSMLNLALPLIPERSSKANSFCFGLNNSAVDSDEVSPDFSETFELGDGLDQRYALDYMPALRTMAAHEHEAEKRFAEAMKTNSEDGMPLARRTSRRRKPSREHYFDRLSEEFGKKLDGSAITGKDVGGDISRIKLSFFRGANEQSL